jgi:hypothetical protein
VTVTHIKPGPELDLAVAEAIGWRKQCHAEATTSRLEPGIVNLTKLLLEFNAHKETVNWFSNRDAKEAWNDCKRGDWLLWFASRLGIDRKLIVHTACDCAQLALPYAIHDDFRPRLALHEARKWCNGMATPEQVHLAAIASSAAASDAARTSDSNAFGAATAASAAAYTASLQNNTNASANAGWAALDAGAVNTTANIADVVRQRIPWTSIEDAITNQKPNKLVKELAQTIKAMKGSSRQWLAEAEIERVLNEADKFLNR